jgi:hypothetical protein
VYLFYILALIPVGLGLYLHHKNKEIHVYEWLIGSVCAFIIAGTMHAVAIYGQIYDTETWSGEIVSARHFPEWKEYYEYAVYRTECYTTTDSKGNSTTHCYQVFDHWEPTSRIHPEYFEAYSNIATSHIITESFYRHLCDKFKSHYKVLGDRQTAEHNSRKLWGDDYDYITDNTTGWCQPITKKVSFENRIKSSPSVFSFIEVPETIKVEGYPKNKNPFSSDRLRGIATEHISLLKFDQFNARLGPTKKVNVILIGFKDKDSSIADYQQAKYVGGKKNDLCLLYGWDGKKVTWAKVFGWSESDTCKRNLETILLRNPINNDILPLLDKEIRANYKIKDWHKFDYIAIEPRNVHYVWYFVLMIGTQGGLYCLFHREEFFEDRNSRWK